MDFGGLDSGVLVCSDSAPTASVFSAVSDVETKQKWCGSAGFLKQERPSPAAPAAGEDDWRERETKVAKTSSTATMLRTPLLRSNGNIFSESGQQMLSFSSPNSQTAPLPSYYHQISAAFSRNSGTLCIKFSTLL